MTELIGNPYITSYPQSQKDQDTVCCILNKFKEKQTWRNTFAGQWQEIAELILPNFSNTFYYGNYNFPGQKKTYRQIDASGQLALSRFAAILDSLLTPRNMFWESLAPYSDVIRKDRQSALWYEQATKILFTERYSATANFASQNMGIWQSLGAFGTGGLMIDELDFGSTKGLRYRAVPLGELFIGENHQGIVDEFIRWFRLTARQAIQQWGEDKCPAQICEAAKRDSEMPFNFLHAVGPREDYEPGRPDAKGKPWYSCYVSIEGQCLLGEGGYRTFPMAISRYTQAPGETYGRSPAMDVLPALKTLNAQKATFLKQGHRASDPVLLLADDGLYDFNLRPGSMNKGAMSPEGKPLVGILPTGNIQINEKMMEVEQNLINDAFLVRLFQILEETPQMTATEVIERVNEKGILLAPTVGRQQSEYLGPMTHRELDILSYLRMLPPMPPALREAKGEYEIAYTTPISRAMKAQEAAGFMRTVETVKELVNITQDASLLDPFDFDTAIPAIADIQAVPASWMASQDKIAAKRQNRAKAQQAQQQIQAMPAQAAMLKAQATVAKNEPGVGQGQGGMGGPVVPQQAPQPAQAQ